MSHPAAAPARRLIASRSGMVLLLAFGLLVAPGLSGCAANHGASAGGAASAAAPMASMVSTTPTTPEQAAKAAAWSSRPDYVRANARTEEAYAYAMQYPHVLGWMPCYCGCGAMGHKSNVDCYFKPTMAGLTGIRFEEHASYCEICVDITLTVKKLVGQGQSLRAVRDAIDRTFGGSTPGTLTDLPPA